jgi:L-fuconolactonase
MYRADGPAAMKPVGEIEFVNGTAAMSASGQFGKSRLCAGIVGHADLRLGDGVTRVLEAEIAAGDGRFRGIRHSVTWDPSEMFSRGRTNSPKAQMADATWRAGFARLAPLSLTFEAWLYHPQLMELADLARAFPQTTIILNHVGGPLASARMRTRGRKRSRLGRPASPNSASAKTSSSSSAGSACCSVCSPSTRARHLLRRRSWRARL